LKPVQKPQKILRQKKKTNRVSIHHWEQASFLPKIKYPVAAQVLPLPQANGLTRQRETLTADFLRKHQKT
jgi:hypothetical protein